MSRREPCYACGRAIVHLDANDLCRKCGPEAVRCACGQETVHPGEHCFTHTDHSNGDEEIHSAERCARHRAGACWVEHANGVAKCSDSPPAWTEDMR